MRVTTCKAVIQFDNHDKRIKYYELSPERGLTALSQFPLPNGYRFVFCRQGDSGGRIAAEQSEKELKSYKHQTAYQSHSA